DFVIFEKDRIGGLVRNAFHISNYPGFPEGLSGKEFADNLERQLRYMGIKVIFKRVERVSLVNEEKFQISYGSKVLISHFAVIATGTLPKKLENIKGIENVSDYLYYDVESLPQVFNKRVAIIGSGDIAFDYALSVVSRGAREVYLLIRGNYPKCNADLLSRVSIHPNIRIIFETHILSFDISHFNSEILIRFESSGNLNLLNCDIVLVAIGRVPDLTCLDSNVINSHLLNERIFMIGDVNPQNRRYLAFAVKDGLECALKIYERLKLGG
ncbi:MAG: NAD(P)/FAD-dependent oxidoreductase, partial [Candidatus Hydrothermia bacterium]